MNFPCISPHNHRVNTVKHVIAMFKEHFISALATVNRNCPLQLWDDFVLQMEPTLNLLRFSQRDPTKSTNEEVNGKFGYNKTPLAPSCTKVLVYNDPAKCASWALHGTNAYYVGPALNWVADTWPLYPTHCTVPTLLPPKRTILEAMDTLSALGSTILTSTRASMAQTQAIQNKCDIVLPVLHQGTSNPIATDMPSPRVLRPQSPATPETRVPMLGPSPRVTRTSARSITPPPTSTPTQMPTTFHDPTAPANIRLLRPAHQQHTQSNNPFAILEDNDLDDNNNSIAEDITVRANNRTNGAMLGISLQLVC
jgi:hypothetical protein